MKHLQFKLALIAVMLSFALAPASAYDFEVGGMYYNIVSPSDLTCEVTHGDNKYMGDMVIPSTVTYKSRSLSVTSIDEHAFSGCSGLTSITIHNSVTEIGNYAFSGCSGLKSLVVEDGTETLILGYNHYDQYSGGGQGLFYDCPIETLYLGRNLSYYSSYPYGYSPFANNKNISNVTIGSCVTSIGNFSFSGCSGLKSLVVEDGTETLKLGYNSEYSYILSTEGQGMFYDCPIETLYLGRNLSYDSDSSYGYSPFYGNKNLTSVTIGNSVTYINYNAFQSCSSLTSVTIGDSVTSIHTYAFKDCSGLTSITIGNSVTEIGYKAFENCSGLTSVIIPNSVTQIYYYAFLHCSGLTSVTIGNSVTEIGYDAFYGCSGLTSVTIGNSVTKIGNSAFGSSESLTSITSLNPIPPSLRSSSFKNKVYIDATLYVPQEALSAYQSADVWKDFWDIQGIDVTGIQCVETKKQTPTLIYDINGRKLIEPKKGLNIINGKKMLVK